MVPDNAGCIGTPDHFLRSQAQSLADQTVNAITDRPVVSGSIIDSMTGLPIEGATFQFAILGTFGGYRQKRSGMTLANGVVAWLHSEKPVSLAAALQRAALGRFK